MIETYMTLVLFLLLPIEITATPPSEEALQELRQGVLQVEIDTRAWRQKKTGRGL